MKHWTCDAWLGGDASYKAILQPCTKGLRPATLPNYTLAYTNTSARSPLLLSIHPVLPSLHEDQQSSLALLPIKIDLRMAACARASG